MLLPYYPHSSADLPDGVRQKAQAVWLDGLCGLLASDDEAFAAALTSSGDPVATFVLAVLADQLDSGCVDDAVLRQVYMVFVRLGERQHASLTCGLATVAALDAFALVFARDNPLGVQACVQQILGEQRTLREQYELATDQLAPLIDAWTRELPSLAERIEHAPGEKAKEKNDAVLALLDRVVVVARLVEVRVANLTATRDWLLSVMRWYDAMNGVLAAAVRANEQSVYAQRVFLIKQSLVHAFNALVHAKYLKPFSQQEASDMDALAAHLSQDVLTWVEGSDLDTIKTAYLDAPLLVDWQIEAQAAQQFHHLNNLHFHGENEQLSFLALVFEAQVQANDMTFWKLKQLQPVERKNTSTTQKSSAAPISTTTTTTTTSSDNIDTLAPLIAQIKEMFPDLGDGFIAACLDANDRQPEQVIMQLLEDNLPPTLAGMDRAMPRISTPVAAAPFAVPAVSANASSVLDSRHNVFDNDAFDVFAGQRPEKNKVIAGKKDTGTADKMLGDKKYTTEEKAKVLQRVFDMYDDEIDDAYDSINEISGKIDLSAVDDDDEGQDIVRRAAAPTATAMDPGLMNEKVLVQTFVDHRDVFDRSSAARRSKQRDALRKSTNMTDEQLEGWAIMFDRNPRKQRILDNYRLFDGQQEELTQDTRNKQQQQSTATAKDNRPPPSEAKQRAYKDKNKARFANHQRKKMHDKKQAKMGGPAP
ncbi:hypothetical protein BC940DRAFT_334349 [Gongronella butleri]|nr:hypothetical protein BC940DRAFT_334349 [Gongronella butleri]